MREVVIHMESECQIVLSNEYVKGLNNASKILMTTQAVKNGFMEEEQCWCKLK